MKSALTWSLGMWLAFILLLSLPKQSHAACLELKQDNFQEGQGAAVTAVRSFCFSEFYGTIFKAEQDLTLQTVRLLISGDGKNVMETTTLKLTIYKEKAPDSAEPGEVLSAEVAYQVPPNSNTKPHWLEVKELTVAVKKGESFRVVFAHENVDCELRVTDKPLCAEECSWWGASVDAGPTKPNTNLVLGSMFKCPEVTERKWRFWKDLPANCRPSGNLILRVMAYDGVGPDCKGGVTPPACQEAETKPCKCQDGGDSTQTCTNAQWAACKCQGTPPQKICQPGGTQKCVCTKGDGVQTCNTDGSAWEACKCDTEPPKTLCTPNATQACKCPDGGDSTQTCTGDGSAWATCQCTTPPKPAGEPIVEKITPKEGMVGKNTEVTIIGQNFAEGAKVKVGSTLEALNVKIVGPTTITAVIPAEAVVGKYNITVTNPDGKSHSLLDAFQVITTSGCGCSTSTNTQPIPAETLLWLLCFAWWGVQRRKPRPARASNTPD